MKRRAFLAAAGLALVARPLAGVATARAAIDATHPLVASWTRWKARYLASDGRVIDDFQDDASHSEGQGYGMTLATVFRDEAAFDAMFSWTERRLAVRADGLLAWRWRPVGDGGVLDENNATDGDILCAWALTRAAEFFDRPSLLERAGALVEAVAARCVAPHPDGSARLVLLPAVDGFVHGGAITVNPSYIIPSAMDHLAAAHARPQLARCGADGMAMLGALAADGLVPDWVTVTADGFAPAPGMSASNGYDAMRVALYLAWHGAADHPAVARQAAAYRLAAEIGANATWTPTVIETASMRVTERSPHAGYAALRGLILCLEGGTIGSTIPPFTTRQPYYPATLHLLALVAQAERYPRCVPI